MNDLIFQRLRESSPPVQERPHRVTSCWQSPANIALVKYWGKRPGQLPLNPSLSMTLSACFTQTQIVASRTGDPAGDGVGGDTEGVPLVVNGDPGHPFIPKMALFLRWIQEQLPALAGYRFGVTTRNSFPPAAGIASSASGLSAFALGLLRIAQRICRVPVSDEEFFRMASYASRMGSGSACRSLYGGWTVWGRSPLVEGSSDGYAVPVTDGIDPLFRELHDTILVVSSKPKSRSSSAGHRAMEDHPFAVSRVTQANRHTESLFRALQTGGFQEAGELSETEALVLHSLLMTSPGGIILLEPATLAIISRIREARSQGLPVFFTLDAGANVHLLHPALASEEVDHFCRSELQGLCEAGWMIADRCGKGPIELEEITMPELFAP